MALSLFLFIILIITISREGNAARILCIYPIPFDSHQQVFHKFTEELAQHGHDLVVLTPLPHKEPIENVTEIDVHNMSYTMWQAGYDSAVAKLDGFTMDPVTLWEMVFNILYPLVEAQFNVPEMQAIIQNKEEHFDLIIVEGIVQPALMISARFNAPVILVSSFYGSVDNFHSVGAPIDPIFFPEYNIQKIWNLSLWDKITSFYTYFKLRLLFMRMEESENMMVRRQFGPNAPTISELKKNIKMLFLNVHHIWDNNRPVPPSVLYMGALHLRKPKTLPSDLESYLDRSRNGVVYMSLGSKIKSSDLPPEIISTLMRVFSSLPYDILWKWNGGDLPGLSDNVRLEKWLPQNDLLHHPKVKAFITQGGLQSTDEAIAANVPLIGMPVFADQYMNVQKYLQYGIGLQLDLNNLDEEELKKDIISVAEDKRYRDNIKSLSSIMSEQRFGAVERALQWIQYIAKHKEANLHSPLANISYVEYYMLDIIAPLGVAIAVLITISSILLKQTMKTMSTVLINQRKFKTR